MKPVKPKRVVLGGSGLVLVTELRAVDDGSWKVVGTHPEGATVTIRTCELAQDAPTFQQLYRRAVQRRLPKVWAAATMALETADFVQGDDDLAEEILEAKREATAWRPPPDDYPTQEGPGRDRMAWCGWCDLQTQHDGDGHCTACGLRIPPAQQIPWLKESDPGRFKLPWDDLED